MMDTLAGIGNTILYPIYWVISGLLVGFHRVLSPLLGAENGWTWVLSIVLMTMLLRAVMLPLYKKQMNAARAMTSVQPHLKELQAKYKDDRQRLGSETMKLYEQHGVSPYASCLPMLVQMPVFMGLFWVINSAARYCAPEVQAAGQCLPGASLSLKGWWLERSPELAASLKEATIFGSARLADTFLGASGWEATRVLAVVLIVAMMGVLFVQQWRMMHRNMPPAALSGPMGQTQKMMYAMPLMYVFIGGQIPIGVLFYWVVSNTWTWVQQEWIMLHYPTPDTPAYVDWEERMIAQGKDPREIEKARIEAGRRKGKGPSAMSKMMASAERRQAEAAGGGGTAVAVVDTEADVAPSRPKTGGSPGAAPARTAAVIRTDEATGKQVIVRTQPVNVSRAKRKK